MDPNGIPYWSGDDVEDFAAALLAEHLPSALADANAVRVLDLALALRRTLGLKVTIDMPLGANSAGQAILGSCYFKPPTICIDPVLARDPQRSRFRFVLAHEIGHLHLHGDLPLDFASLDASESRILDTRHDLRLGRRKLETARDWLEWQANRFAAAILMPRAKFGSALERAQDALEIRRPGHVYVDDEPHNVKAFHATLRVLAGTFETSTTAAQIRLDQLSLLTDRRDNSRLRFQSQGPVQIGAVLREIFAHAGSAAENDLSK